MANLKIKDYVHREYNFLGELATDKHYKSMRPFEENENKNRYCDILCYEDTRVKLKIDPNLPA